MLKSPSPPHCLAKAITGFSDLEELHLSPLYEKQVRVRHAACSSEKSPWWTFIGGITGRLDRVHVLENFKVELY